MQTKIYEATASVIVSPRVDLDISDTLYGIDVLNQNVAGTYVQILNSQATADAARAALSGQYDEALLDDAEIQVQPVQNSTVIVIIVRSEEPALARDLANGVATQAIENNPVESLVQAYPIKILDAAELPEDPISPKRSLNILLGTAGGGIAGVGLAFLADGYFKMRRARRSA
jgi:capsular polysaccharide biosynthesis protein